MSPPRNFVFDYRVNFNATTENDFINGIGHLKDSPVPAFAINTEHVVTQWNRACEILTGVPASAMLGTRNQWQPFYDTKQPVLADLIIDGDLTGPIQSYFPNNVRCSLLMPCTFIGETFFPRMVHGGKWIQFSAGPVYNRLGNVVGAIETLQDVSAQKHAEQALQKVHVDLEQLVIHRTAELMRRNDELTRANEQLISLQQQLLQSEKLASIGQLAAGVAHEINNPISYIFSNFGMLDRYLAQLMDMLDAYEKSEPLISQAAIRHDLSALRDRIDLSYLKADIPVMMRESLEGIVRVRQIVQDLKDFSRVDNAMDWQLTDLHPGINSTLNIVSNEVRYKANVILAFGTLPDVECLPSQINQVVMNLIINAAQSIGTARGTITIRTGCTSKSAWIEVADDGSGISAENRQRIFDPFFTTKPIGTGTGLGLSMSYGIVSKHHGRIDVDSTVGVGTTFRVTLPLRQPI
ncbi:ATP-binding protein [Actimicrobium sp. CCI2.3]|uniref:ATP-binding protein n=1 Tax=Actimicrobium sp. CCI2.3 TaxID=3048616 RepID=UPI002AB5CC07|nr:ATP-binding protein [Actimicrobium sp. CCI2.3]MDY7573004.1 ATP-binding protein [Actimicrobium sp. CCI2.3]MEB0023877.1 ATP-binding protein [Actimicrobium sp. CCI2.3]